jgi:hypothetical protein
MSNTYPLLVHLIPLSLCRADRHATCHVSVSLSACVSRRRARPHASGRLCGLVAGFGMFSVLRQIFFFLFLINKHYELFLLIHQFSFDILSVVIIVIIIAVVVVVVVLSCFVLFCFVLFCVVFVFINAHKTISMASCYWKVIMQVSTVKSTPIYLMSLLSRRLLFF